MEANGSERKNYEIWVGKIKRCLDGDRAAVLEFISETFIMIRANILSLAREKNLKLAEEDLEDLSQNVAIRIFGRDMMPLRRLKSLQGYPKFVHKCCKSAICDWFRAKKRRLSPLSLDQILLDEGTLTLGDTLEDLRNEPRLQQNADELLVWFLDARKRLITIPLDRLILDLSFKGYQPAEIADQLETGTNRISVRKNRILGVLRSDLRRYLAEETDSEAKSSGGAT